MMEALNLMREIAFPADYKLCRYLKFKDFKKIATPFKKLF